MPWTALISPNSKGRMIYCLRQTVRGKIRVWSKDVANSRYPVPSWRTWNTRKLSKKEIGESLNNRNCQWKYHLINQNHQTPRSILFNALQCPLLKSPPYYWYSNGRVLDTMVWESSHSDQTITHYLEDVANWTQHLTEAAANWQGRLKKLCELSGMFRNQL